LFQSFANSLQEAMAAGLNHQVEGGMAHLAWVMEAVLNHQNHQKDKITEE
jgi:hypothetical protein